jgi:ABC-2 type transport system permease protein
MLAAFIVTIFYCLDALYGERRDRSILFWKSLPVSDLTAVLAKASIPLVAIPLITFAITVATQWLMLLVSTAVLAGSGLSVATLWTHWPQMWLMLLYHLLAVHSLWYAPFYAWMLLVSAWARRTPFLWAFLPLLVCSFVERIAFNTWHFAAFLGYRLSGEVAGAELKAGSMAMDPTMFTPGRLLSSPGLWAGLIFAALCIAAAARLRRYRGPI